MIESKTIQKQINIITKITSHNHILNLKIMMIGKVYTRNNNV
jgi:hypothetical protein